MGPTTRECDGSRRPRPADWLRYPVNFEGTVRMSLTLAVALYFIIWWTILFAVLPFGVRTQAEEGSVVPGTPESAPVTPRLVRVAVVTSIAAAAILALVWLVLTRGLIDLDLFAPPNSLPAPRK